MSAAKPDYHQLTAHLDGAGLLVDAAEVHGLLSGFLCAGMAFDAHNWLPQLADLINDGQTLPTEIDRELTQLHQHTCGQLTGGDFGFQLLLPAEERDLEERLDALASWSQGFLAGIGLQQADLDKASDQLQEALHDLAEIANVGLDIDDAAGEENEQAFAELNEYVRVAAMLTFSEFGQSAEPDTANDEQTLH